MPSNPWNSGVLPYVPAFSEQLSGLPVPQALGQRPALEEETEIGPSPAAMSRAQTVFETTGVILILLIALAAAWILIRRRL